MSGGFYGLKGYFLQAIMAMLECLENIEWTDIKLEPGTTEDKVDFILYINSTPVKSVQVKSSINKFNKKNVEDWLNGVCRDVPQGTHELILIGEDYADSTEKYIKEINQSDNKRIKTIRMDHKSLVQKTNGTILEYMQKVFPEESFATDAIFTIYDRLFSALMHNGLEPVYFRRGDFCNLINNTLSRYLIHGKGVFSDDEDMNEQIWKAMKLLFTNMKAEGGRFAFDIIPELLPEGRSVGNKFTAKARTEDQRIVPVREIMVNSHENLALIGTGGIGKTTYLQSLLEECYLDHDVLEKDKPVSIFVELFRCPSSIDHWTDRVSGDTNFVIRSIAAICENHQSLESVSEGTLSAIEKEFQKTPENGKPEYYLLLDGFNEVSIKHGSSTRIQLSKEILAMSEWPNIRIIATSRETEYAYFAANFRNVDLIGLEREDIFAYLDSNDMFSAAKTGIIMADERLLECIRIPLYLLMYSAVAENNGFNPQTPGEILYAFFHRNSAFYSLRKRAGTTGTYSMEEEELYALLNFVLPFLGWFMDEEDTFYLESSEIKALFFKALEETIKLFSMIHQDWINLMDQEIDIPRQLSVLISLKSEDMYKKSLNCIQNYLGLLYFSQSQIGSVSEQKRYSFAHHQFRDYFSAIWNSILLQAMPVLQLQNDLIDTYLGSSIWQQNKVHMMSEVLMEHRNKSCFVTADNIWKNPEKVYPEQKIIEQAIDCLRNKGREGKYLISNLLRVIMEGRHELVGLDLGELNLENFSLNGISCSKGLGDTIRLTTGFFGSSMTEQTLETSHHKDLVIDVVYGDEKCYTLDMYGTIKCWDIRSSALLQEWQSVTPDLYSYFASGYLKLSPDRKYLAVRVSSPDVAGIKLINLSKDDRDGQLLKMKDGLHPDTFSFSGDSRVLLALDQDSNLYSYNCADADIEWTTRINGLYKVTRIYQETAGDEVWLFSMEYNLKDTTATVLWEPDDNLDDEEDEEYWIPCEILTWNPQKGKTEIKRSFSGQPGTTPAACYMAGRNAVLYFDGEAGSLKIGEGKEAGWEVFKEITSRHTEETMTLYRHHESNELFYIVYPDELYLVSINSRFHCNIVSRYRADTVNKLAKSRGQEDDLSFYSASAPSGRYFILINEDGIHYEWDEKENTVSRKYNTYLNECVGIEEDSTAGHYILVHRNNSICFFDSDDDRMIGSVNIYEPGYEITLCHFVVEKRALLLTLVRLDHEKVVSLNVDTGECVPVFSSLYKNETIVSLDSDPHAGQALLTTQYRCCEIDLESLEEREVAKSEANRRFVHGKYNDNHLLEIIEIEHESEDDTIRPPLCMSFSRENNSYKKVNERIIKELPADLYPFFICHNSDFGITGTYGPNGLQKFWMTEGFFLSLPENHSKESLPLKPFEKGFVWHRHELRHYGEYKGGDIRIMSENNRGTLFVRNSRTMSFFEDIRSLTYETLDNVLDQERGYLGGNSYWTFAIRLQNGDFLCSYEGCGLMRIDGSTGEMIRDISYTPGLALWGCNFRKVIASDEVKEMLRENGAIVSES